MSDPQNPYGQQPDPTDPHGRPYGAQPYGSPQGQPGPTGEPNPYGQQPQQNPYGQQAPQENPYGAPPAYGQQPAYGQPAYGQPGYGPGGLGPAKPNHPSATTSMVLGIIGLGSLVIACGIGLILSPFAWVMGGKAVKEIDASNGQLGGRDQARAGQIMGIIGTVILVLMVIAVVAFFALVFPSGPSDYTFESTPVEYSEGY
ncbi:DUF4190 domain-containing protein [Nocardioides jishulii]|uniref:DUF4190 domain-containing protein n=1 Tax=Nocardioides jishulii TaxID=2575440 RepID=UPI0015866E75|nr:DUF4190 domain-containing protein [Nocardioides jishulii]